MATYEVYLGGASSANSSRGMFPAPSFSAANTVIKAMRPSLHKGGFLNRVLDFTEEQALTRLVKDQVTAGAPITTADVLGLLVIPQNIIIRHYFYEIESASNAGMTLTPKLRVLTTAQGLITASALNKGMAAPGAAWVAANGALTSAPLAILTPDILDLTITAIGSGFGAFRLNIGIAFDDMTGGQY